MADVNAQNARIMKTSRMKGRRLLVGVIWRATATARCFSDDGFARRAVVIASGEMLALPLLSNCIFSVQPFVLCVSMVVVDADWIDHRDTENGCRENTLKTGIVLV